MYETEITIPTRTDEILIRVEFDEAYGELLIRSAEYTHTPKDMDVPTDALDCALDHREDPGVREQLWDAVRRATDAARHRWISRRVDERRM